LLKLNLQKPFEANFCFHFILIKLFCQEKSTEKMKIYVKTSTQKSFGLSCSEPNGYDFAGETVGVLPITNFMQS